MANKCNRKEEKLLPPTDLFTAGSSTYQKQLPGYLTGLDVSMQCHIPYFAAI